MYTRIDYEFLFLYPIYKVGTWFGFEEKILEENLSM